MANFVTKYDPESKRVEVTVRVIASWPHLSVMPQNFTSFSMDGLLHMVDDAASIEALKQAVVQAYQVGVEKFGKGGGFPALKTVSYENVIKLLGPKRVGLYDGVVQTKKWHDPELRDERDEKFAPYASLSMTTKRRPTIKRSWKVNGELNTEYVVTPDVESALDNPSDPRHAEAVAYVDAAVQAGEWVVVTINVYPYPSGASYGAGIGFSPNEIGLTLTRRVSELGLMSNPANAITPTVSKDVEEVGDGFFDEVEDGSDDNVAF